MLSIWQGALGASGLLIIGYFGYRLVWHLRHGPRTTTLRLEGRVIHRDSGQIALEDEVGRYWLVRLSQPTRPPHRPHSPRMRPPALGATVVVEGNPAHLMPEERLYRQAAGEPRGMVARRLIVGRWPELRWLRVPVALACLIWLVSLGQLLLTSEPAGRLFQSTIQLSGR